MVYGGYFRVGFGAPKKFIFGNFSSAPPTELSHPPVGEISQIHPLLVTLNLAFHYLGIERQNFWRFAPDIRRRGLENFKTKATQNGDPFSLMLLSIALDVSGVILQNGNTWHRNL